MNRAKFFFASRNYEASVALAVVLLASALVSAGMTQDKPALPTPPEVWQDYDPDAGDFKEEIVSEETKNGVYSRSSYISAYVNGEEIRVFCQYAVKAGATKAPGLMNVHGWMAQPSIDMDYVNDGWAVMAHDYCGKTGERTHYTKYPEKLKYGNMDAKEGYRVKSQTPDGKDITDPKQTDDYLWYAIQRRVLSYLLAQKVVDKSRIGAKGFSYGGSLMWNLAMDPRVKAVVSYFGIGWIEYYRDKAVWMHNMPYVEPPKSPGEALILSAITPEAHAPYIRAACLWMNGTNDHHGGHERGEQMFKRFQPGVPWAFAHQARGHHDTGKLGNDAKLWLEKYVLGKAVDWPAHPVSEIRIDAEGVPEMRITPAEPDRVARVEIFYAMKEPNNCARFWYDVKAERQGDVLVAKLPVRNIDDYVFSFGNLHYPGDIVISTDFTAAIPSKLGHAVATRSDAKDGSDLWTQVGPAEVAGVNGLRALDNREGTTSMQFDEPGRKAPDGAVMNFRFYCTQPQTIIMTANDHFSTELEITASDSWQSLQILPEQVRFKGSSDPLASWSQVKNITLRPKQGSDITKVVFEDITWLPGGDPSKPPLSLPVVPVSSSAPVAPTPAPPSDSQGRVYLTKEMATKAESYVRVQNNLSWDGNKISVGGTTFQHGLGVHAPSEIVIPLEGKYAKFHVVPGPDDEHRGSLEMSILVDDREVYSSGTTSSRDTAERHAQEIPLAGAKTLTLIVTKGGDDSAGGDHASWADAYLVPDAALSIVAPEAVSAPLACLAVPQAYQWMARHEEKVAAARKADIDIVLIGDSLTHYGERSRPYAHYFEGRKVLNLGFGGDRTQNMLWRLQNGEIDGLSPKLVVLMIGTNNAAQDSAEDIVAGIRSILAELQARLPTAKVLLFSIFPRAEGPAQATCARVNALLPSLADGDRILYLDINREFLDSQGALRPDLFYTDLLHLSDAGYSVWYAQMEPHLSGALAESPRSPMPAPTAAGGSR